MLSKSLERLLRLFISRLEMSSRDQAASLDHVT